MIPRELAAFGAGDAPAGALPAGAPGKDGLVELEFAPEPGGGSGWVRHRRRTPLTVMRPLHVDPADPGLPVTYLMATGAGLVQGDRTTVDVTVRDSARALVTTQAATKVHRMDHGHATAATKLAVGAGARLEYLPDPAILHAGSRLHQSLTATVAEGATLIAADAIVSGRLAHGERHGYDAVVATMDIRAADGLPLVRDRLILAPGGSAVVTGGADVIGSLIVVTPHAGAALAALREVCVPGVRWAASALPHGAGAWARYLTDDTDAATAAAHAGWAAARRAACNAPAFDLRRM